MTSRTITLDLPESLYVRLQQAAQATQQSFDAILLRVVQVGSPPGWDDVPAEFQTDLAALDRLDDTALWQVARVRQSDADMTRYQTLLDKNSNATISSDEKEELNQLRTTFDRHMLRKAQALALLRWRGHQVPSPAQLDALP
ncbi:MAG: hypothetical protein KDJ65_36100 [Anaerolineae bacterium]|nr:hypothetical protein [Anaerolineae bacterium]